MIQRSKIAERLVSRANSLTYAVADVARMHIGLPGSMTDS